MVETSWWTYVQELIGDDSPAEAAARAGFDKSAFTRWKKGANADPAFVVRLVRAYGGSVLEGLVAAGTITNREAGLMGRAPSPRIALQAAPDDLLLSEVQRRMGRADLSWPRDSSAAIEYDDGELGHLITLNPAASDADADHDPDAEVEAQQSEP
ncbi:hypothetical protein Celgi_1338 [Cellulomonas gilvus ATCC 13127]|uniref:Uncharacterized protein n=2 Tax=Cellulomonas gilvus TaxID=11 RepID=F8A302_CELGA|nr:hypothetical protein Celgi_1338 [Cellulomonas gilvus ATCC 13127]